MKFSFVLPAYNEEKIIQQTLSQFEALRDAGIEHEVIVSDNGSTDPTPQLVRDNGATAVELNGREKGTIGECRNRGAEVATGDVVWFLDADVQVPNIVEAVRAAKRAFANEHVVALTCPIRIYEDEERWIDRVVYGGFNRYVTFLNAIKVGGAPGDCQVIRRSVFKELGGFDASMPTAEDFELYARLVKRGKVKMLWKYPVRMSARRIRRDGWPKILWQWSSNWVNQVLLKRKSSNMWEARR